MRKKDEIFFFGWCAEFHVIFFSFDRPTEYFLTNNSLEYLVSIYLQSKFLDRIFLFQFTSNDNSFDNQQFRCPSIYLFIFLFCYSTIINFANRFNLQMDFCSNDIHAQIDESIMRPIFGLHQSLFNCFWNNVAVLIFFFGQKYGDSSDATKNWIEHLTKKTFKLNAECVFDVDVFKESERER